MANTSNNKTESGERLRQLRARMAKMKLDGFIVPRSDAHQGEYVPPSEERLIWLTGFSGSAGLAVVLKDKAALFVDGRYGLQARHEVDTGQLSIHQTAKLSPMAWIAANAKRGARIGFDPWLVTGRDWARFGAGAEKAGAKLVSVSANPIDAIWTDRPLPPMGPVKVFPNKYSGKSARDKRSQIAGPMAAAGIDAAVLSAPESIAWLLNIRGSDVDFAPLVLAFAVITRDGRVTLIVNKEKISAGVRRHLGEGVTIAAPSKFGAILDQLGKKKRVVLADNASTPAWILNRLKRAGAQLRDGADPCVDPKARKNKTELKGIRAAHIRDGAALCRFLAWFAKAAPRGGQTEMAAAKKVDGTRAENDLFQGLSFPTISAAGPNGAIIHYRVTEETNRSVKSGDVFLLDSGAQYLDGTTDVTRTFLIGPRAGLKSGVAIRERFTRVLKGHIGLASARFPVGTTGSQLDVLARKALWDAGLDYDHGTGHGIGHYLSVHEGPQRISQAGNSVVLEPGMLLSNEPGFYQQGEFGIRTESLLVVRDAAKGKGKGKGVRPMRCFDVLTLAPIDRALIDRKLLSGEERNWLDAYHARVRRLITPLVDPKTAEWLKQATKKI